MDQLIPETRLLEIAVNPSSPEYNDDIGRLVLWGLEHRLIEGCDGFVVKPADFAARYSSLDELALDYLEDAESKSGTSKMLWLREHLKSELLGPREDSPSFTQWVLDVGSVGFVICVLVIIEGHEPVAIDYFAVSEAKEIIGGLRARSYLVSDSDVDALTDEELIAL